MKKIFPALLISGCLFMVSCDHMNVSTGNGSHKISGNGKFTSEARSISAFSAIHIEGVFNIILQQGNTEAVKVETDENLQPIILTEVKNDTLTVKFKDDVSISNTPKIDIYITLRDISALTTAGVGSLKCPGVLRLKQLILNCEGVGSTHLNIVADKLDIHSEIVGELALSGKVKDVTINHSGVGMLEAFGLKAENLSLKTDGVGAAEVFASNQISIVASGIGNVSYKGGALTKNIKSDGLGKVKEIEE